jgi:hypothetical protein
MGVSGPVFQLRLGQWLAEGDSRITDQTDYDMDQMPQ